MTGILLLLGSAYTCYFFYDISRVNFTFWDEVIYVNAARAYIETTKPFPNPEHPPFGKELIALSIKMWGDNPLGWRFFCALSGALSCVLIVYLVYRLTRRQGVALFVGALLFLDPLLFIHFRIAMLDPPLLVFLLLGSCFAIDFYLDPQARCWRIWALGTALGLGLASKLLALVLLPIPWGLVLFRLYQNRAPLLRWLSCNLILLFLPPLIYLLSYRVLGYHLGEVRDILAFNFDFHRTYHGGSPVSSPWYEWLYIGQPIWYFWKKIDPSHYQSILGTGNLVLWIAAQGLAVYALVRRYKRPELWMLAAFIFVQFLLYSSKPNTFLYYMVTVLPFAYILMGVGIADLFDRYGNRYRRILQIDFACLWIGAFLIFWGYRAYISGKPITEIQFKSVNAQIHIDSPDSNSLPTPATTPK